MKKISIILMFAACFTILYKTVEAQIPILYYDFENNSDRTDFENEVEADINSGSGALTKAGGNGSALHIRGVEGAGIYNQGVSTGMAISTQQGGWSSSTTDPGTSAAYYYQFVVNTSGFSGITISFDNNGDDSGPARTGVLWSTNGTTFNSATTSPVLTGNNTFSSSGQFVLPSGVNNLYSVTIRIYAYEGSASDRTGRSSFSSHGKFSIDNVTVLASSIVTNAGTKTLLSESDIYTCVKSGSTGSVLSRNGWSVNSGSTAILSSDFSLSASQSLTVLSGGTITMGTYSLLESGAAGFTLSSGAAINVGSVLGISSSGATGNIQTTTRNFSTGANYFYNGSLPQSTGNGLPSAVNDLTIINSAGVALSADVSVTNVLTLTSGIFAVGSKTLTIGNAIQGTRANLLTTALSNLTIAGTGNGIVVPSTATNLHNLTISNFQAAGVLFEGNININNGTADITGHTKLSSYKLTGIGTSTLKGSPVGKIGFTGDLATQISGFTTNTFCNIDGGQYSFAGTSVQTIPSGTYANLQAVNSAGMNLSGTVIITGTLTLNGVLNIGSATLSISNPIAGTLTNLTSTANSNLIVSGFMPVTIPSSIAELKNLNISNNQIVTAGGNLTINGTLTLEQSAAFLNMGANTLTIGTGTSNTGEIVRNGGSIRGAIKRWFANGTSADKIFPLDNGSGAYSQAKITFNTLGTGGTLTATFHNSGSGSLPLHPEGNYIPAPELHVNIVNIAPQYWTITAGDGLTNPNYNLELTGDAIPNISNINYVIALKRPNSGSDWTWSFANHSVTTGTSINPVLHYIGGTSFSDFGVGGNIDNLLPVELSSFTSNVIINNVKLSWSTVSEENNSVFEVERKSQNTEWTNINNVAGNGTSNTLHSYSCEDRNLASGKYNYRLKQIDFNGNFRYYELLNEVIIGAPKKYALSQNYPNPFNPSTTISYEISVASNVILKVYDTMGKEIASLVNQNQEAGFYSVKFDGTKLSSGIYFYILKSGDFTATKKLILVK